MEPVTETISEAPHQPNIPPDVSPRKSGEQAGPVKGWENVSGLLETAASEMVVGEMIHGPGFSLHDAMSAIELMEPKMDVGCGEFKNSMDVTLPESLSHAQVVAIMDELLACLATWLNAHTLPQTVFSCVYVQRLDDIPRADLRAFIRAIVAVLESTRSLATVEFVCDDEDLILNTFGFDLVGLSSSTVTSLTEEAIKTELENTADSGNKTDAKLRTVLGAIEHRLRFIDALYASLRGLVEPRSWEFSRISQSISKAMAQLEDVKTTRDLGDPSVVSLLFDPKFNRHLLTHLPPRTAAMMSVPAALEHFEKLLGEFSIASNLKHAVMHKPPVPVPLEASMRNPAYSLLALIRSLNLISSEHAPCVVTRSAMKRMLTPAGGNKSDMWCGCDVDIVSMFLTDISITRHEMDDATQQASRALAPLATHIVAALLRNRGRQRRELLHTLSLWDKACTALERVRITPSSNGDNGAAKDSSIASNSTASRSQSPSVAGDKPNGSSEASGPAESRQQQMFDGKTSVQLLSFELIVQGMVQHWLLGFECDLYQAHEYAPVYFYVGYALTTAVNATSALGRTSPTAKLHPCRLAMHALDEGRLWLCRALFSLLEALRLDPTCDYTWGVSNRVRRARKATSNDEKEGDGESADRLAERMWYDQRFGAMGKLMSGPQYMNHETFLSMLEMQRDKLRQESAPSSKPDMQLRLDDTVSGLKYARQALERANLLARAVEWDLFTVEAHKLARVAIANSVAATRLIQRAAKANAGVEVAAARIRANFSFNTHCHFPVVSVQDL